MPVCDFCSRTFTNYDNVRRHQSLVPGCRAQRDKKYTAHLKSLRDARLAKKMGLGVEEGPAAGTMDIDQDFPQPATSDDVAMADVEGFVPNSESSAPAPEGDPDAAQPESASATTTPAGLDRQEWRERFPGPAGATFGKGKTTFEEIRDEEILKGAEVLGPFKDEAEWELAKWLIKNVGHTACEEFLQLAIISERAQPSYTKKKDFFEKVDNLPGGVKWECRKMDVQGDVPDLEKDPTGATMRQENLELWFRDPVECVRELIGNPIFRDVMKFAPEKLYADEKGEVEIINEMWTANWWWELQKRLPPGVTIVPLILSSDKTMLSNFRGDNSAWPVYLTIGNIGKETRRQVSAHATVLIGYLPIPKFDCFEKETRALAKYRLFHKCMSIIMATVAAAGRTGVNMVCSDNFVRNVWPIFAAYVADYPEQCLVSCCKENRCPMCKVKPTERGDHLPNSKRDKHETLNFMDRQTAGEKDPEFEADGIRAVPSPFWRDLPHSDIFQAFTPDLLHQLHKGVFKDHLVKWCTEIIGKLEVDNRFRQMPDHHGLRHFKNGISSVSQWTGTEHKEMEKVFLGLVAADPHVQVVKSVRALMDFAYFASLQSHTSETLLGLRNSLDEFHANKQIFIDLEARKGNFNFPKMHALDHYEELIRLFGSADGFNTESPERLHIDYAKNAYRASNRKDYIIQMTLWLQRQESVARFSAFREWMFAPPAPAPPPPAPTPLPPTPSSASSAPSNQPACSDPDTLTVSYSIAKRPPPAMRRVLGSHIISQDGHNAPRFLSAVSTFLQKAGSSFVPHDFDVFSTWKRISFTLPNIPEVGKRHATNVVRATAPLITLDKSEAAHHDFALVRTGESNPLTEGSSPQGESFCLRVAQVHVIFQLPAHYRTKTSQPLAYIEWFTPFRTPNTVDGYYHVARSTRKIRGADGPYAEIITADRIARSAMLIPQKWGQDTKFLVNSHIDGHSFCMFKLGRRDCLPI
ncbi:hypothetical protein C8J57DRAFT_1062559 [Mycena rebaudengoi]|nr:hypothetical protein C8J57DRAFT_1062559 [Mycena rebaudengoi]